MERSRLQAAIAGDVDARVELGRWIARELLRFFARFPPSERDDLVQDTAADLFEKLNEAPDDPKRFRGWMWGFARVQELRFVSRKQRERADELQRRASPRTPTAALMFEEQLRSKQRQLLARAIEQLPDNLRRAIEDRLAGRDHKSVAHARGVTMNTARWLLWRATEALRELVESMRLTPSSARSQTTAS